MFAQTKVIFGKSRNSHNRPDAILLVTAAFAVALLFFCRPALSQQTVAMLEPEAPEPVAALQPAPVVRFVQPSTAAEAPAHRFWDRENSALFAASAALSAADFVV